MDADQIGLHFLTGFLSCIPVGLLGRQLVAARLEGLPAHIAVILLIIGPRVCGIANKTNCGATVPAISHTESHAHTLTGREGVHGGIGPLLTDIRQSNGTVAVLPTSRSLGSDHGTVLLFLVARLVWEKHSQSSQGDPILGQSTLKDCGCAGTLVCVYLHSKNEY